MATAPAPKPISLFDLLFPATGQTLAGLQSAVRQLAAAEAAEAPAAPAPPGATPVAPAPPLTLVQGTDVRALAATYLGVHAPGWAQVILANVPALVPAQQSLTQQITPPTGQVLVLLAPLVVATDLHTAALRVTVQVDQQTPLVQTPMTLDEAVLVAEQTAVQRAITVTWQNGDWDDVGVTLGLNAVAVEATTYAQDWQTVQQAALAVLRRARAAGGGA